jgi:integral membrane protein
VGVGLITVVFVGVPLRYLAGIPEVSQTISPIHGLLYMVYLALTADLALKCRFSAKRTVAIMLAGTIPFLSFVAERRVSRLVRQSS